LLEKYPYYDSLSNKYYSTDLSYTKRSSLEYESNLIFERRYSYDVEGRLKNFESSGKIDDKKISAQYRYDPFGRRIGKLLSTSSGVKSIFYIYNRFGLLAESDENGAVTKAYAFNPTKAVAGTWSSEPLWQANVAKSDLRDSGSKYNYLHVDNLGAPILATDSDGFVAWETIYGAYGIPYIFLDNAEINLRYPGQYFDEESNSNYNFFRNYRYDIGRYIQADPIGVDGGLNLYSYSNNNPLIYFDIFGLQALGCNDYVLGRPRIVTTEMPIEEHLYTLYIPGASYENPGAKAGGA
jgi:RHS repeat-associated protein